MIVHPRNIYYENYKWKTVDSQHKMLWKKTSTTKTDMYDECTECVYFHSITA